MPSPLARWKVRHLVAWWVGYWVVLAVAILAPAAGALWDASRPGAKGDAGISYGDGVVHAHVAIAGSTSWELKVAMTTLTLMLAGPPLLLWAWWMINNSSAVRRAAGSTSPEQLPNGDALPLREQEHAHEAHS